MVQNPKGGGLSSSFGGGGTQQLGGEKQTTDIEEGTFEDILDHFDPMNSAEMALLDEEIEKNRELDRRRPKGS